MPVPDLQVEVGTSLGTFWVDFAWPQLRRFGEFDGLVKQFDPAFTRGRPTTEVLRHQSARRAAIEEATGWSGMHWGWPERADAATLWTSLTAQGWPRYAAA